MNPEHARELLLNERSEIQGLRDSLNSSRDLNESQLDSSGELSGHHDQHPADQATETFEREQDLSIDESLQGKLGEIDAALERLDRGEYGTCQVCGRPIDDERLEALPATRFCRDHARSSRDTRGMGPDVEITQELGPVD
ncbi:MAG TPA: TraR/DksA C4-type zinc finger protein [Acidimicrobiia bacterium]|jgi:RNA polymerase-binding transcription factor DksA|nr:TraR/DksA C4-type zinc finger protein [Acidimicrobiia bacterium]